MLKLNMVERLGYCLEYGHSWIIIDILLGIKGYKK